MWKSGHESMKPHAFLAKRMRPLAPANKLKSLGVTAPATSRGKEAMPAYLPKTPTDAVVHGSTP